ncbi:hypothetical protein D9M68_728180 [compost metagenome]
MVVGAGQQHRAGLRRVAGAGDAHRQRALSVEPVGHAGGEGLVDVLHGHHRRAEVGRQRAQQRRQRGGAAGGGADRHQARRGERARGGLQLVLRGHAASQQPADIAHLAQQRAGGELRIGLRQRGRIDRVDGAVAHRVEHLSGIAAEIHGDHHDRAGRGRHDPARGFDAVHHRHQQVHQDQVRRAGRGHLHGLLAVDGDPGELEGRVQRDGPAQCGDRERGVVDDADFHERASPIRSCTASSSAASWKLPFAR